ncbi:hypothetical protein K502DRAFT_363448 [Neoconidiobolus thromboides FSU 785]|nr:hypothetical protein K502DRAFT_363448 [Neoconidiobolus thromboides FSU 785]
MNYKDSIFYGSFNESTSEYQFYKYNNSRKEDILSPNQQLISPFSNLLLWKDIPTYYNVSETLQKSNIELENVNEMLFILDKKNQDKKFHCIIELKKEANIEFYLKNNSNSFKKINTLCYQQQVFNNSLSISKNLILFSDNSMELSHCAVCLDRLILDSKFSTLTLSCGHIFHANCMLNWNETKCPLCRHSHFQVIEEFKNEKKDSCHSCTDNLERYLCLICGFKGCFQHTSSHCKDYQHSIGLRLKDNQLLDFIYEKLINDGRVTTSSKEKEIDLELQMGKKGKYSEDEVELLEIQLEIQKKHYENKLELLKQQKKEKEELKIKLLKRNNELVTDDNINEVDNNQQLYQEIEKLQLKKNQLENQLIKYSQSYNESQNQLNCLLKEIPNLNDKIDYLMKKLE